MSPAEKLADEDHLFAGSCRLDTTLFQNLPKKSQYLTPTWLIFYSDLILIWLISKQFHSDFTQLIQNWLRFDYDLNRFEYNFNLDLTKIWLRIDSDSLMIWLFLNAI